MPTDTAFLAAVAAAPHDRLPRLVYADWLDEHDDPRGELIRLEEETRERVAWDDMLWKLKPRRNELRKHVDAEWLKAMDYGQDVEPLFRGQPFPEDWRDGWRLIREAHERWTGEPMPDIGGRQAEIEETERRLGLTLPPSVREYVAFAHDLPRLEGEHGIGMYRDPYMMELVPGHLALSLIMQAEGDVHWAIQLDDLRRDDPPVHTYYLGRLDDEVIEGEFVPSGRELTPPLSRFLFGYGHRIASCGSGSLLVSVPHVARTRSQLEQAFPFTTFLDDEELYEMPNLSAALQVSWPSDLAQLCVNVSRPVTREQVPAFLFEFCTGGGGFSGIFAEEHGRAYRGLRHPSRRPLGDDDEIPF